MHRLLCVATVIAMAVACGDTTDPSGGGNGGNNSGGSDQGGGASAQQPPASALYGPSIDEISFEIDYMPGAEPYTGNVIGFGDTFQLLRANVQALFDAAGGKIITIPSSLDDMEELGGETPGESYDADAILAIAGRHRDDPSHGDVATYYAIWLDGLYDDGDTVRDDVLGVSLGDTGVIAMFKPVIEGSGADLLGVDKFVEQAVLIHEFGHAAGLVNNGIEMDTPHQDTANGAHCDNHDCIMYFAIEGRAEAVQFVHDAVIGNDTILWGPECLADAAKASGQ